MFVFKKRDLDAYEDLDYAYEIFLKKGHITLKSKGIDLVNAIDYLIYIDCIFSCFYFDYFYFYFMFLIVMAV